MTVRRRLSSEFVPVRSTQIAADILIFEIIFLNENCYILIQISSKLFTALLKIMTRRRTEHYMNEWRSNLLTHVYITRARWVEHYYTIPYTGIEALWLWKDHPWWHPRIQPWFCQQVRPHWNQEYPQVLERRWVSSYRFAWWKTAWDMLAQMSKQFIYIIIITSLKSLQMPFFGLHILK